MRRNKTKREYQKENMREGEREIEVQNEENDREK